MKTIWLLTEEKPKRSAIYKIINFYYNRNITENDIKIIPLFENKRFTFLYKIEIKDLIIYIKIIKWQSSFVDFLLFEQKDLPKDNDTPNLIIEETKTNNSESWNTDVFQRASKFVFFDLFFNKNIKKLMLFNFQKQFNEKSSPTNLFWLRCLKTLWINIIWYNSIQAFSSIQELINEKEKIKKPHNTKSTPLEIFIKNEKIYISWKLVKIIDNIKTLSHDPNIGAISLFSYLIRFFWWKKDIIVINHWLIKENIKSENWKFFKIAKKLNIQLDWIIFNQKTSVNENYWKYDKLWEKNVSILLHIISENIDKTFSIFDNHWWCEKWYFLTNNNEKIALKKLYNNEKIYIPDLTICNNKEKVIINIEAKKSINYKQWLEELNNYKTYFKYYLEKYYIWYKILNYLVLFGDNYIDNDKILCILKSNWEIILNNNTPLFLNNEIKKIIL